METMNEPNVSDNNPAGQRLSRLRERIRGMFPFASGVLATLLALFLYNFLFPASQVTESEVNVAIANAMASATPRPAYSAEVYQIIQPSLVLIRVELQNGEKGLGTGVIIDDAGNMIQHEMDRIGATKENFVHTHQSILNQIDLDIQNIQKYL